MLLTITHLRLARLIYELYGPKCYKEIALFGMGCVIDMVVLIEEERFREQVESFDEKWVRMCSAFISPHGYYTLSVNSNPAAFQTICFYMRQQKETLAI